MDRSETISATIGGQRPTAQDALASRHTPARSLYLHVPFCFHKCHYCDFYSIVDTGDRHEAFVRTLVRELEALAPFATAPIETIFVGGGTPTLLAPAHWSELLGHMHRLFDLAPIRAGSGEFTIECNPETATPELFDVLVAGGVNRVSIGAQSFNETHLKTLERWHDPASVPKALAIAAAAGVERRSVDLIYAIPGQTLAEWDEDLDRALALDPGVGHVSAYALTYEPNTAMTMRMRLGDFEAIDEDLEASMFERTTERLSGAGFERYEVSNYARPDASGGPARHNLAYWRGGSWLAAGPSASGHVRTEQGGWRWKNAPRLTDWQRGVEATGFSPVDDLEPPDPARALAETIMLGLRLSEGLDATALDAEAARLGAGEAFAEAEERERRAGRLARRGGRLELTESGWLHADAVAAELMASLPR